MTTEILTPVQVIQQLIAMCTTRKELLELMGNEAPFQQVAEKNDSVIRRLLDELSLSGDGVSPLVDRTDKYFTAAEEMTLLLRKEGSEGKADQVAGTEKLFYQQVEQI